MPIQLTKSFSSAPGRANYPITEDTAEKSVASRHLLGVVNMPHRQDAPDREEQQSLGVYDVEAVHPG
jgi:hypothetical protein